MSKRLRELAKKLSSSLAGRKASLLQAAAGAIPSPPGSAVAAEGLEAQLDEFLEARREGRLFISEYPYRMETRRFEQSLAGRRLLKSFSEASPEILHWLAAVQRHAPDLAEIPEHFRGNDDEPFWVNGMIPVLDGMMLYAMVRALKPRTYLEVGSGNSTKFVRKAIQDGNLATRIISIDPHPRAGIDALCDEVVRKPFEDVSEELYADRLQPDDIVFVDNSHRSFQNSDVTVFFTETLSVIPKGVIVGIHDICLPFDYPDFWSDRFYNEQYLLVAYLLGGAGGDQILFPGTYVASTADFEPALSTILAATKLKHLGANAGAFWMRRGGER